MVKLLSLGTLIILLLCICTSPTAALTTVDPDSFICGTDISNAFPGISLSVEAGYPTTLGVSDVVYSVDPSDVSFETQFLASTGSLVFGHDAVNNDGDHLGNGWWRDKGGDTVGITLRVEFVVPTDFVSIDFIGANPDKEILGWLDVAFTDGSDWKRVEADLGFNEIETLSFSSSTRNIGYISAGGYYGDFIGLDNLKYNPIPEPATMILLGFGLIGLAGASRRKLKK